MRIRPHVSLAIILMMGLGPLASSGCASSRELNRQEERQLKVDLVKEHAREMTPAQRMAFLGTRFGTSELAGRSPATGPRSWSSTRCRPVPG